MIFWCFDWRIPQTINDVPNDAHGCRPDVVRCVAANLSTPSPAAVVTTSDQDYSNVVVVDQDDDTVSVCGLI